MFINEADFLVPRVLKRCLDFLDNDKLIVI